MYSTFLELESNSDFLNCILEKQASYEKLIFRGCLHNYVFNLKWLGYNEIRLL